MASLNSSSSCLARPAVDQERKRRARGRKQQGRGEERKRGRKEEQEEGEWRKLKKKEGGRRSVKQTSEQGSSRFNSIAGPNHHECHQ
jgi:hypothetical protein